MYFATPAALIGAATVAGLVAAYLYRAQFRRRSVSSLMLWRFAVRSGGGGRRRDRLRLPLIFYLELAVLALLLFAALSPHIRRTAPPPLTVVLDTSASMSAGGSDGQTPAVRAASFLSREIRRTGATRMKVVAAPADGPQVFGQEEASAAGIASGKYGDFASPGDSLADAISRARRLATGGGSIVVLTDHVPPEGFSQEAGVSWFAFGEAVANDAISFASRTPGDVGSPDSLYVELRRFPPGDRTPFALAVADRSSPNVEPLRFSAAPDATGVARFATPLPPGFGDAEVRLVESEEVRQTVKPSNRQTTPFASGVGLAIDNEARLPKCETPQLPIAIAVADERLATVVRRALDASGFAWRPVAEGEVPAVVFAEGGKPDKQGPAGGARFRVVFHKPVAPLPCPGPYLTDSASPFAEGADFTGLVWPAGTNAPPGRAVLFAGRCPVIAFREAPRPPTLGIMASGAGDAFFRSTAWPVMVWNALDYAAGLLPDAAERVKAARPHRFPVSESDCSTSSTVAMRGKEDVDLSSADFRPLALWAGLAALALMLMHQIANGGTGNREQGIGNGEWGTGDNRQTVKLSNRQTVCGGALRAAAYALALLALARPATEMSRRNGTLVVVADRSASIAASELASQGKLISAASSRMKGGEKLGVVSFAATAEIEQAPQQVAFSAFATDPEDDGSDIDSALDAALGLIEPNATGRIVLLTDGRYTGDDPLSGAASRAFARGIPIDYRLAEAGGHADTSIAHLDAPLHVADGAAVLATAWVSSPTAQTVEYVLRRGGTPIFKGKRQIPAGLSPITFRDDVPIQGVASYDIAIMPEKAFDARLENNRARFIVSGGAGRPLLVIPASPDSRFLDALASGGVPVVTAEPAEVDWTPAGLAGYSGIVVENRRADEIGSAALSAVASWVEVAGGGFALTGGRNSFGAGGYYRSPIEKALPVSMELRNERRKFSVAVAVALDRSGSMSLPAGGGRTKMDLADIATADVVDMLAPNDEVSVFAVDCEAHEVLPLMSAEEAQSKRGKILGIKSEGGGIFVYNALVAALKSLEKSKATVKHVILFADAADSEEPGDYATLLDVAAHAGITVSVIGLGRNTDCDAVLLEDIASLGHGMCAFSEDPHEIPRLFAQDTITVARSAMVTNQVLPVFTSALPQFTDVKLARAPALGGYNLTYLQQGGVAIAVGDDENEAPLLSIRSYGSGRPLAFAGEADGEYTGPFGKWSGSGAFHSALARYVAGQDNATAAGFMVVTRPVDGGLEISAYADSSDKSTLAGEGLALKVMRSRPGMGTSVDETRLSWKAADLQSAVVPVSGSETVLPVIVLPDGGTRPLPPYRLPYSAEFRPDNGEGAELLAKIASLTGGARVADVASAWDRMGYGKSRVEWAPWLYVAAALFFLLVVVERRTGWIAGALAGHAKLSDGARLASDGGKAPVRTRRAPSKKMASPDMSPEPEPPPPASEATESSIFTKAKQRAGSRTGRKENAT